MNSVFTTTRYNCISLLTNELGVSFLYLVVYSIIVYVITGILLTNELGVSFLYLVVYSIILYVITGIHYDSLCHDVEKHLILVTKLYYY